MKKILICILFALDVSAQDKTKNDQAPSSTLTPVKTDPTVAAPRDKTEVNETPEAIKNKFNTDHPGQLLVSWRAGKKEYKVTYTDPKTNSGHIIFYDKNGKIIRTEGEVTYQNYPSAIKEFYSQKFPGEKYKVWETEKIAGQKLYYIPREKQEYWFDKDGKFITKKRMKERK